MYKISRSWVDVLIFKESCLWPEVISASYQKQQRINICYELRQIISDDATFLFRVITGDESWIYGYDLETKQHFSQWKSPKLPTAEYEHAHFSLASRRLFTKNSS
jgi:hypothetical protein